MNLCRSLFSTLALVAVFAAATPVHAWPDKPLRIVHIPYKGGAQAQTDVVGGQVRLMFNVLPSALLLIRAGKLKALAGYDAVDRLEQEFTLKEALDKRYGDERGYVVKAKQ